MTYLYPIGIHIAAQNACYFSIFQENLTILVKNRRPELLNKMKSCHFTRWQILGEDGEDILSSALANLAIVWLSTVLAKEQPPLTLQLSSALPFLFHLLYYISFAVLLWFIEHQWPPMELVMQQ
jgi:hypothetical protein